MDTLDQLGGAFFRLYRMWSRRQMRDIEPIEADLSRRDLSLSLVVQLVADTTELGGAEVTVGAVADGLDMDASNASRAVAEAVKAGYVARAVSQIDGRRSTLTLTEGGAELLERVRRHQRALFDRVTYGWSRAERYQFARLFTRYVNDLAAARAEKR